MSQVMLIIEMLSIFHSIYCYVSKVNGPFECPPKFRNIYILSICTGAWPGMLEMSAVSSRYEHVEGADAIALHRAFFIDKLMAGYTFGLETVTATGHISLIEVRE
jgi:hypothetical protein